MLSVGDCTDVSAGTSTARSTAARGSMVSTVTPTNARFSAEECITLITRARSEARP
jgi:hypothetical protein